LNHQHIIARDGCRNWGFAIAAGIDVHDNSGRHFEVMILHSMHTYKNNLRMNETQLDIKAQCLKGGEGNYREGHCNEELKNFRKTIKRLEFEADALKSFLKRI
jgi:hypothetical protein